jgi:hypothetical protein
MHPMFAQLYLEPDAEDEQDGRRRAARNRNARRLRSARALARVNGTRVPGDPGSRAAVRAR